MTSHQLAHILLAGPDLLVVLSKDEEGNGFGTLSDLEQMVFDEDNREVGYRFLTPELEKSGYTEEDLKEGRDCVVLWP